MINYKLLFILLIIYIILKLYNINENFINLKKNAFCLLTKKPNIIWLDFLNTMINDYDVFICVDILDDYSELKKKYNNIKFIEISDDECIKSNYINSDFLFKPIVATDRAFYYFNHINNNYNYIWYCEDNVYFYNVNIIKNLDMKYPNADIISSSITINNNGDLSTWAHWHIINNTLPLPWCKALLCLVRISKNLMKKMDEYIIKYKKNNYKEYLFHTLAIHNNMIIETPIEMSKIYYRYDWKNECINKYNIYHPIKNLQNHLKLRSNK